MSGEAPKDWPKDFAYAVPLARMFPCSRVRVPHQKCHVLIFPLRSERLGRTCQLQPLLATIMKRMGWLREIIQIP